MKKEYWLLRLQDMGKISLMVSDTLDIDPGLWRLIEIHPTRREAAKAMRRQVALGMDDYYRIDEVFNCNAPKVPKWIYRAGQTWAKVVEDKRGVSRVILRTLLHVSKKEFVYTQRIKERRATHREWMAWAEGATLKCHVSPKPYKEKKMKSTIDP